MNQWKRHVKKTYKGEESLPIVEVLWKDAWAKAADWCDEADNDLNKVTTVGYLTFKNDEVITIYSMISEGQVGHGITIPMSTVVSVRTLHAK